MILREVIDCGYTRNFRPSRMIRRMVEDAIAATKTLRSVLGLNKPRIGYVKEASKMVATYANGSAKDPIILIDDEMMEECGADAHQVRVTLIHEFFHAYLETLGLWLTEFEHDEDLVEDIARDYGDGVILAAGARERLRQYAKQFVEC